MPDSSSAVPSRISIGDSLDATSPRFLAPKHAGAYHPVVTQFQSPQASRLQFNPTCSDGFPFFSSQLAGVLNRSPLPAGGPSVDPPLPFEDSWVAGPFTGTDCSPWIAWSNNSSSSPEGTGKSTGLEFRISNSCTALSDQKGFGAGAGLQDEDLLTAMANKRSGQSQLGLITWLNQIQQLQRTIAAFSLVPKTKRPAEGQVFKSTSKECWKGHASNDLRHTFKEASRLQFFIAHCNTGENKRGLKTHPCLTPEVMGKLRLDPHLPCTSPGWPSYSFNSIHIMWSEMPWGRNAFQRVGQCTRSKAYERSKLTNQTGIPCAVALSRNNLAVSKCSSSRYFERNPCCSSGW